MQKTLSAYGQFTKEACSLEYVFQVMCEEITETIGCTRASIWSFSEDGNEITCHSLFDLRTSEFTKGATLSETFFPTYFKAIREYCVIDAADALKHPQTECFSELYFRPNDIHSLLDYVLMIDAKPVGILCCENCGEMKQWKKEDVEFLMKQASVLGLIIKKATLTGRNSYFNDAVS